MHQDREKIVLTQLGIIQDPNRENNLECLILLKTVKLLIELITLV